MRSMRHWNYRIIEFAGHTDDEPARRELREVHYDDNGRPSAYGQPASVAWDVDEGDAMPLLILERMREALAKPALFDVDFDEVK
jgi:hypothetical protein